MLPESPDYSSFAPIKPSDWEQAILKELKGQPISSLIWEVEPGIHLEPIQLQKQDAITWAPMPTVPCAPAERIIVVDVATANTMALTALEGGVRALEFELHFTLSDVQWELLLKDIQLEFISIHIYGQVLPAQVASINTALANVAASNNSDLNQLTGALACAADYPWSREELQSLLPKFQCSICVEPEEGTPSEKVAAVLTHAALSFQQAAILGIPANEWQYRIFFDVQLGNLYYTELCKLRALRWLWAGLLDEMGVDRKDHIPASISARISHHAYGPDAYDNMIRSACIGTIGMVGGSKHLVITPVQSDEKVTDRSARRMARNVVHLLQLESYLDKVQDPAAGSYYLETYTTALAQSAWNKFHSDH